MKSKLILILIFILPMGIVSSSMFSPQPPPPLPFFYGNAFSPQYIFAHDNQTRSVLGANEWTNVSFSQEEIDIKRGITHTHNDVTNTTFTINADGIYEFKYTFSFIDTSASASDIDVAARVIYINGTEIIGSVFETDITKQQVETELTYPFKANLKLGDQIILQFIATDADIQISTHGTFGDHPDSVTLNIDKKYNLPR